MAKSQSRKPASRSVTASKRSKTAPRNPTKAVKVTPVKKAGAASAGAPAEGPKLRTNSKQVQVIAMLTTPHGATIEAIMKATGWQQHSVRGFFAGVVRKKLKLDLVSEVISELRRYRIKPANGAVDINKPAKAA